MLLEESIKNQLFDEVRNYEMPDAAGDLITAHPPLILAGITASGKSSILKHILRDTTYLQVITHTTRQPRQGELQAQHYHFVDDKQMLELVKNHFMIEVQAVHGEAVYGTSIGAYQEVVRGGHKPVLIIDVQGVEVLNAHLPLVARPFFILPPDFDTWMRRLEKRGRMSHAERLRRMRSAREEIEMALKTDHFLFIVNNEVSLAAEEVISSGTDAPTQHKRREAAQMLIDHLKTI